MHSYMSPEMLRQIYKANEKLQQLKIDIQLCNQKFRDKPASCLEPKGPMSRILSTLEDCEFFFDQFMKAHGLKYLPIPNEDEQALEEKQI